MKINEKVVNILIVIFVVAIIGIVYLKFVLPIINNNKEKVSVKADYVSLLDMNGKKYLLKDLLSLTRSTYCLVFRLDDCWSCAVKGLNDMNSLRQDSVGGIIVVVHHSFEDVKGWSQNYLKYKIYFLDIKNYFENIKLPMTPVILKFENTKLIDYKYETI